MLGQSHVRRARVGEGAGDASVEIHSSACLTSRADCQLVWILFQTRVHHSLQRQWRERLKLAQRPAAGP
jgi:hypothetical protein